jgi:acyl-ACP thioesterase
MSNILYNKKLPHYSSSLFEKKHIEFFHVDFCNVDFTGKATISAITNYIQETAWQHANRLKIGYFDMQKQNMAFAINKMLIKLKRLPSWNEMISVETWLHPPQNVHATREFTIRDNSRNLIVAATVSYIAINTKTRKLSRIPKYVESCCTREYFLEEEPSKISVISMPVVEEPYKVKPSDIDMNQHVNNSKYLQWVFDYMPAKYRNDFKPISVNINFLNEAHLDDELSLYFTDKNNLLVVNGLIKQQHKSSFLCEILFK